MSSTFDTMQHALEFLRNKIEDDLQADDVIHYLQEITQRLHDYSHDHGDILNKGPVVSITPELLRTALRYDDDNERREWLKRKSGA